MTLSEEPGRDPLEDYRVIREELRTFDPRLAEHVEVIALTKADLPDVREAYPELKARFAEQGLELHLVSAVSHDGLEPLLHLLADRVDGADKVES